MANKERYDTDYRCCHKKDKHFLVVMMAFIGDIIIYSINIKQQSKHVWEQNMQCKGMLYDPIRVSPNKHDKKMETSKGKNNKRGKRTK